MALAAGARLDLLNTPARAAGRSEARMPAYRYGIVLLLLFATFVFLAVGPTGDWVPLVAVVLQGATLLAALSASGKYGPLLLVDSRDHLPVPLQNYLLDIQPGYRFDPVRGVYNHAWLMGDESAISVDVQARIDSLAEITKVKQKGSG